LFAQNKMLTALETLSYTDPQYIDLRERIKETINAVQQLSDEEVTVAPAPAIEGKLSGEEITLAQAPALGGQLRDEAVALSSAPALEGQLRGEAVAVTSVSAIEVGANRFLAPDTRKKLQANPKLIAALFLAVVSVTDVNEMSKHTEPLQTASFDTESPLSRMGDRAQWIGADSNNILASAEEDVLKKIVIVRPNTAAEAAKSEANEEVSDFRMANMNFASKGETPPEVVAEAGALSVPDISEDNLPKVSEIVVNRFGYEPTTLGENTEATVMTTVDTSTPEPVAPSVTELDPKSPEYQESIAPTEAVASSNKVVEVLRGTEATYPDRAINPFLAAVDSTGIPEVLASKLRAEEKEAFLSDSNRLKAAGVGSGQRGSTFPGEKIDYSDPVQRLEQRFNEVRQYLNVPHTEVAVEGDNLTKLVEKSFARDLAVLSEADRLPVVEEALAAYLATPGALENLKLTDKDMVQTGAVVPLQVMARYLADAVAKKVLTAYESGSASEVLVDNSPATETSAQEAETNTDTFEESGSASEVITDGVISPENYPGGILEYSKAYNEKLESLGIASKAPSMIDSWFTQRSPDNRALLAMSVGELTKIMMQAPTEVARELEARKVSIESANSMYELIIKARAEGQAPYDIDSTLTGEEVIRDQVLAEAPKN
jgi:hypothetical protein